MSSDGLFAHKKAEYIIFTAVPLLHCVHDIPSMLRCMYSGHLVAMILYIYGLHLIVLLIFNRESKFYDSISFTGIFHSQFYLSQFSCLLTLQVNIQCILDPDFILWTRIITSSL